MEAKFAYQERKAEIVAERKAKVTSRKDKDLRRAVTDLRIEDSRSERSSTSRRRHSHRRLDDTEQRSRPEGLGRHYSSSSTGSRADRERNDSTSPRSPGSRHSKPRSPYAESEISHQSRSAPTSPAFPRANDRRSLELVRRRTDMDLTQLSQTRRASHPLRSISTTAVDMDLAYGDYHPSSIVPLSHGDVAVADEKELLTLVERARLLLDEANCAQHSVKAIMEHLQKNPDAMAAVALTLAEISNIASKMAPGALAALKGSAPAVFALLASPQFLIAAGVGIGVTVVMFGGYKIIKKIKAKNAANKAEGSMEEMLEIDGDEINRINQWRRGILAEDGTGSEIGSVGTSVDGEFITPLAASMRGMETREDLLAGLTDKEKKKRAKKENKQKKKVLSIKAKSDDVASEKSEGSTSSSKRSSRLGEDLRRRALVKVKKPSPLRRLLA
jgi:hypothetical protein